MHDQLSLLAPPAFDHPLRFGSDHYVPILKSKAGELNALTRATEGTWDRMTPLIEGMGAAGIDDLPSRSTYPNLANRLALAVSGGRPFYLDFPWLDSRSRVNIRVKGHQFAVNAIEHVHADCRSAGLAFIPVLSPIHDAGRAPLVRAAIERDGRGVCLRVQISGVVWEEGLATTLDRLLQATGASRSHADLLLDLSYLPSPPGFEARHIQRVIEELNHLEDWRSLILAGTVIPASGAGWPEGGITEVPRHEWQLYRSLRGLQPRRMPAYGDFAVQHPEPPEGGGPGMRASIRYTSDELVLFARGHALLEHGTGQYHELCQLLVDRQEYLGSRFSWGDDVIGRTASGASPPGGEPLWRGAGTSHHLALMAAAMAALP